MVLTSLKGPKNNLSRSLLAWTQIAKTCPPLRSEVDSCILHPGEDPETSKTLFRAWLHAFAPNLPIFH